MQVQCRPVMAFVYRLWACRLFPGVFLEFGGFQGAVVIVGVGIVQIVVFVGGADNGRGRVLPLCLNGFGFRASVEREFLSGT